MESKAFLYSLLVYKSFQPILECHPDSTIITTTSTIIIMAIIIILIIIGFNFILMNFIANFHLNFIKVFQFIMKNQYYFYTIFF